MSALTVEACGPGTTVQDAGRTGFRRFGVSTAGAMDRLALALANVLVGNHPGTAAVEFTLVGGRFRTVDTTVAVAAVGAVLTVDGRPIPAVTGCFSLPRLTTIASRRRQQLPPECARRFVAGFVARELQVVAIRI